MSPTIPHSCDTAGTADEGKDDNKNCVRLCHHSRPKGVAETYTSKGISRDLDNVEADINWRRLNFCKNWSLQVQIVLSENCNVQKPAHL